MTGLRPTPQLRRQQAAAKSNPHIASCELAFRAATVEYLSRDTLQLLLVLVLPNKPGLQQPYAYCPSHVHSPEELRHLTRAISLAQTAWHAYANKHRATPEVKR